MDDFLYLGVMPLSFLHSPEKKCFVVLIFISFFNFFFQAKSIDRVIALDPTTELQLGSSITGRFLIGMLHHCRHVGGHEQMI